MVLLVKAVELYRIGTKGNDMFAQFNLGRCYYHGKGMSKDVSKAIKFYTLSAERSNILAQYVLATIYEDDESTIEKDLSKAILWYKKVAEHLHFNINEHLTTVIMICAYNGNCVC